VNLKDFSNKNIEHIKNSKENASVEPDQKSLGKIENEFSQSHPEQYEDIKKAYDKYSNMEEQDLMSELIKTTQAQKEAGTLDEEQIKSTYNMIYPMLNDEQKKKLNELIKVIK
jgi:catalase